MLTVQPKASINQINLLNKHPFRVTEKNLIILPSSVSEAILFSPVIKNLRCNFGQNIQIDVIGDHNTANLFTRSPYINNFYLDSKIKNRNDFLKNQKYDTIFLFNFPVLWTMASFQQKVKQRVSFDVKKMGLENLPLWKTMITHLIDTQKYNDSTSQNELYLNVLSELGLKIFDRYPEISTSLFDNRKADEIIRKIARPIISINCATDNSCKDWPIDEWAKLLEKLKQKYECSFIAFGEKEDKKIYEKIQKKSGIRIINFCGKTTHRETIEAYKKVNMLITIDSSAAHLAANAGTKDIIIIYGPSSEKRWKPISRQSQIHQIYRDVKCRPCNARVCMDKKCLNNISADFVFEQINGIFPNF